MTMRTPKKIISREEKNLNPSAVNFFMRRDVNVFKFQKSQKCVASSSYIFKHFLKFFEHWMENWKFDQKLVFCVLWWTSLTFGFFSLITICCSVAGFAVKLRFHSLLQYSSSFFNFYFFLCVLSRLSHIQSTNQQS
jgi:hypothetical protein